MGIDSVNLSRVDLNMRLPHVLTSLRPASGGW